MPPKPREHLNLLCDISDLSALLAGSADIEMFLQETVKLVARHLQAQVCSIYLLDEEAGELILRATVGLNPRAVGRVRMKPGEGLVGTALEEGRPIREGAASRNPRFKYFAETDEDPFESLLAVPIQRGTERVGVLVVQHTTPDCFDDMDTQALRASASQLAGAIENARLLMAVNTRSAKPPSPPVLPQGFLRGEVASPGYACAPTQVVDRLRRRLLEVDGEDPPGHTLEHLHRALVRTRRQLRDLQARFAVRLPESASLIFTAHFMILKDRSFIGKIIKAVEAGAPPAAALRAVARQYMDIFTASPHSYIREKVSDIEDLASRVLANLAPGDDDAPSGLTGCIVVARELYPSDVLKLASEDVRGIVLVSGGITSHVAIICRSMQIPLLICQHPELLSLPAGTPLLMDAVVGNLYVAPSEAVVQQFEARRPAADTPAPPVQAGAAGTRDGTRIHLLANINLLSELATARRLGAEGIGLYRTEFPFLIRPTFPTEEEQYLVYRRLFEDMGPAPVTIRTLDVGGDKVLAYAAAGEQANPQLGLRSIRFALRHPHLFDQQLRAILRAAPAGSRLRIMFPMISSLDEFRQARQAVAENLEHLAQAGTPAAVTPEVGPMIELPGLLDIAADLARESDFFSVGTNDLVQYMLAADRSNDLVAPYYEPGHPSVLRALDRIARAAAAAGIPVAICGEIAQDPRFIPFLVGIGIRTLSVDPQSLPRVQATLAAFSATEAQALARRVLAACTIAEIRPLLDAGPAAEPMQPIADN
jgi:phosphotransferase system enzyme I (PtsP)